MRSSPERSKAGQGRAGQGRAGQARPGQARPGQSEQSNGGAVTEHDAQHTQTQTLKQRVVSDTAFQTTKTWQLAGVRGLGDLDLGIAGLWSEVWVLRSSGLGSWVPGLGAKVWAALGEGAAVPSGRAVLSEEALVCHLDPDLLCLAGRVRRWVLELWALQSD